MFESLRRRMTGEGDGRACSLFIPAERTRSGGSLAAGMGETFGIGQTYLTLRLAEMRLNGWRSVWQTRMPICVTVLDCVYAGEKRSLPMIASHKRTEQVVKEAGAAAGPVELRNRQLTDPIPVLHGEIGLFAGLISHLHSDSLRTCLDLLGEVGRTTGLVPLVAGVPLAQKAYSTVASLFEMGDVSFHFGADCGFRAGEGGGAERLQSGYRLFARLPDDVDPAGLWVEDGTLRLGNGHGPTASRPDFDYCLLLLERDTERSSFVDLMFHRRWLEAQKRIANGEERDWRIPWREIRAAIRTSPDLIEADKVIAVAHYRELLLREFEIAGEDGDDAKGADRGGGHRPTASGLRLLRSAEHMAAPSRSRGAAPRAGRPRAVLPEESLNEEADRALVQLRGTLRSKGQKLPSLAQLLALDDEPG